MTRSRLLPGRHRSRSRADAEMVVLDIGDEVVSVWSPTTGVMSTGAVKAASTTARSFLTWLLHRSGVRAINDVPVFLSVRDPSSFGNNEWCAAVELLGGDPLLIHRPLAAGVALGISEDGRRSHLLVEVCDAEVDLAIVQAGSIVVSSAIPRCATEQIRIFTNDTLRSLDPDDELEIRDNGVFLYGWSAARHASEMLAALSLPLAAPVATGATVLDGARIMACDVLPWLTSLR